MKSIYFFLIILFCFSCKDKNELKAIYHYPNELIISDKNGMFNNSFFRSYFPDKLIFSLNDSVYTDLLYPYTEEGLSDMILEAVEEPLLYNFYLDRDVYRWVCERSLQYKFVLTLNKKNNKVWLEFKATETLYDKKKGFSFEYNKDKSFRKDLSLKEWDAFEERYGSKFVYNEMTECEPQIDGSTWWFEVHKRDYYGLIREQSPKGLLKSSGEYLFELSDLKEELY